MRLAALPLSPKRLLVRSKFAMRCDVAEQVDQERGIWHTEVDKFLAALNYSFIEKIAMGLSRTLSKS